LPDIPRSSVVSKSLPRSGPGDDASNAVEIVKPADPDDAVRQLMERLPSAPSKPGKSTETVTKTTFTETSVRRVTDNKIRALVVEVMQIGFD
jgi:hypothetical protein